MKKDDKLAKIFFSYSVFVKIVIEMQRFYKIGLDVDKLAWEAVSYPLGFIKTRGNISPFELISLSDIENIVISHAIHPDDKYKIYSPSRAYFKPGINENVLNKVSPILKKHPKLDFCFKLHSHPNGSKFLSKKDKEKTLLTLNQLIEAGLNTNIHFIMTCENKKWQSIKSWNINAYAINEERTFIPLAIEFINHDDLLLKEALNLPFYKIKKNFFWFRKVIEAINEKQILNAEFCELYRGWSSICLKVNNYEVFFCFSPNFSNDKIMKIIYFGKEAKISVNPKLSKLFYQSCSEKKIDNTLIEEILKNISNEFN